MPHPILVVRTMQSRDIPAVVDLLTTTSTAHQVLAGANTTPPAGDVQHRRSFHRAVDQALRTAQVTVAISTTGGPLAAATTHTLFGVAVTKAPPPHPTITQCRQAGIPAHLIGRLRRSYRPHDRRMHIDVGVHVMCLAVRDDTTHDQPGSTHDEIGAALLSVVHAQLDADHAGCYTAVHDERRYDLHTRLGYTDIAGTQHTPHSWPVRHLWRDPDATGPAALMPVGVRGTWTRPEVEDQIRQLHHRDGWTPARIAEHFGCSQTTVSTVLRGYRRRVYPPVTPDMLDRYQQGHDTVADVAANLGCTYQTACHLLWAAGATITDAADAALLAEIIDVTDRYTRHQQPLARIAADLGRSPSYVRDRLQQAGVELRTPGGSSPRRPTPTGGPPR